jgi:hypothetical protein
VGREERQREAVASDIEQRLLGPIVDHGEYDSCCPKCTFPKLEKKYCIGKHEGLKHNCSYEGEHLHGFCLMCGWGWVERCKDYRGIVVPLTSEAT